MKRGKKLLVMLLALIVLGAGAWAATSLNAEDGSTDATESGEVVFTADTLTSLSWTYGDAALSFTYDNGWTYAPDSTFPLDESFLEAIAEALTEVVANKVIEAPGDLAQFGLEEPVCTVTVNGTATLLLGNESAMGGEVYLSTGDGKVCLTDSSLLDCFAYSLPDLATQAEIPDLSAVTALTLTTETETVALFYSENSGLAYSDHYTWFRSDNNSAVDMEAMEDLLDNFINLTWSGCAAWASGEDDLSAYGLDTPAATYALHHPDGVFTIQLGDAADSDTCYAKLAGSNLIYLISADLSTALIGVTTESLTPDDVLKLELDTVDSVEITLDGKTYTVERTTGPATDAEGNVTTETAWTLNGAQLEMESVLEDLMDMTGEPNSQGTTPERSSEIQFIFHRHTTSFARVELIFYQYDGTNCLVTLNGNATLLVSRTDVVDIIEAINALVL